jgi:CubicO group peptidase (beta-lactamase class C family)
VTPHTLFEAGSLTKAISAATVMQLVEEGPWRLDQPVRSFTEAVALNGDAADEFTLLDILLHRTGLPPHNCLWYCDAVPGGQRGLTARLRHLPVIPTGFRREFSYNNLMFGALGVLFEDAVGEPWTAYATERLLKPIGMVRSCLAGECGDSDIALGYAGDRRMPRKDLSLVAPAGAFRTSVEEMSLWLQFQLRADGSSVLSTGSWNISRTSSMRIADPDPLLLQGFEWMGSRLEYVPGWFVGRYSGHLALFHPAYIDGFTAAAVVVPALDIAAALFVNTNLTPVAGCLLHRLLAESLGDQPEVEEPRPPLCSAGARPGRRRATLSISGWTGDYHHPAYGRLTLSEGNDGPSIRYGRCDWPLEFDGESATATLQMFGLETPIPVELSWGRASCRTVAVPLAFHPHVTPVVFLRQAEAEA